MFVPKLPASMSAVVSGSIHLAGQLEDVATSGGGDRRCGRHDRVRLRSRMPPVRLALEGGRVSVRELELVARPATTLGYG
jgi:hypothetical protein